MGKRGTITGQWDRGNENIKCRLPLIEFKEGGNLIIYCPALDLSGYGATEEEARESFKTTLSEYFRYTVNKKTLARDLTRLGWTLRANLRKPCIPPSMVHLLENNEDFSRIFNNHDFRKTATTVDMPAFA